MVLQELYLKEFAHSHPEKKTPIVIFVGAGSSGIVISRVNLDNFGIIKDAG